MVSMMFQRLAHRTPLRPLHAALFAPVFALGGILPAQDPDGGVTWSQAELESISLDVQADVEKIRGARFDGPVPVSLANREQFVAYATERMERTETPEKVAADQTIARMLGLIPVDMDLLEATFAFLEAQVGGYYDPTTDSFCLMNTCPKDVARIILAHELGHALDDQLFDIDGGMEARSENSDALLAYHSVVEGSGTAVMTHWSMANMASLDVDSFQEMQSDANQAMAEAPMALWMPVLSSYMNGAAFLAKSDSVLGGQISPAGTDAIEAAFANPPRSTEQVLHPEKYWDPAQIDEPVSVSIGTDGLPSGWQPLREDTFGELGLALLSKSEEERTGTDFDNPMSVVTLEYTNASAAGWGGDRYVLVGNDDARFLRVVTTWDTERDAAEFFGGMRGQVAGFKAIAGTLAGEQGAKRATASLEYGDDPRIVVLDVGFGLRRTEAKKLREALAYTIGE